MGIAVVFDYPGGGIEHKNGFVSREEAVAFAKAKGVDGRLATACETATGEDGHVHVVWRSWFEHGVEVDIDGRVIA